MSGSRLLWLDNEEIRFELYSMGCLVDSSDPDMLWSVFGTRRNRPCQARYRARLGVWVPSPLGGAPLQRSLFGGVCCRGQCVWWLLESTKYPNAFHRDGCAGPHQYSGNNPPNVNWRMDWVGMMPGIMPGAADCRLAGCL